jgi:N-acetyltransferase
MNLQPILQNEIVLLRPLIPNDYNEVFAVAANPQVWEQHPEKERYKEEVFQEYFKGALESGSAFAIIDQKTQKTIGCTRFYEFSIEKSQISIGYTFISIEYWATHYNRWIKYLMMKYAYKFVDTIVFHVGTTNFRSQRAVEKLGAIKIGIINKNFSNSAQNTANHVEYSLKKNDFERLFENEQKASKNENYTY